ncbi:hypothetical protein [Absidia glauca]|uniref:Uncharacterized protein n=1 Tax=Absidia glauca TaxID=4829 RepID=A0A168MNA6_ABSGL|nr:hypothetical protein [Absidia glauca]
MNFSDYNGKDNQQEFEKPLHHKCFLWYDRWEREDKKTIAITIGSQEWPTSTKTAISPKSMRRFQCKGVKFSTILAVHINSKSIVNLTTAKQKRDHAYLRQSAGSYSRSIKLRCRDRCCPYHPVYVVIAAQSRLDPELGKS